MEIITPVINDRFTNKAGKTFEIREIAYSSKNGILNFGEFVTASHPYQDTGVNIYKDYNDSRIGYRIAKDLILFSGNFEYYGCVGEVKMLSELNKKQSDINLTEFPTGVVTIDGFVVGQEIPFYDKYQTLKEFALSLIDDENKNVLLPEAYLKVLYAIKELIENGIFYSDLHYCNFLVQNNGTELDVKTIDFDPMQVSFGSIKEYQKVHMQYHLETLINLTNEKAQVDYCLRHLSEDKPVDDAIEKVLVMREKIK